MFVYGGWGLKVLRQSLRAGTPLLDDTQRSGNVWPHYKNVFTACRRIVNNFIPLAIKHVLTIWRGFGT